MTSSPRPCPPPWEIPTELLMVVRQRCPLCGGFGYSGDCCDGETCNDPGVGCMDDPMFPGERVHIVNCPVCRGDRVVDRVIDRELIAQ